MEEPARVGDPVSQAITKLTTVVEALAADRTRKNSSHPLDSILKSSASGSQENGSGPSLRRNAAARRALRESLTDNPALISRTIESLMREARALLEAGGTDPQLPIPRVSGGGSSFLEAARSEMGRDSASSLEGSGRFSREEAQAWASPRRGDHGRRCWRGRHPCPLLKGQSQKQKLGQSLKGPMSSCTLEPEASGRASVPGLRVPGAAAPTASLPRFYNSFPSLVLKKQGSFHVTFAASSNPAPMWAEPLTFGLALCLILRSSVLMESLRI